VAKRAAEQSLSRDVTKKNTYVYKYFSHSHDVEIFLNLRCGDEERLAGCGRYRRDGVTEAMVLLQFNSIEDTRAGIERHVEQLRAPGGLLLLVASLVLSKGL
jgi:Domain of unknown function (DUF4205)